MVVTPLFGIPMGPELVVILLIAILLFGANKIPKLARSTGQALGEFEKGKTKAEQELEEIRSGDVDMSETDLTEVGPGGEPTDASADATADATADTTTETNAGDADESGSTE